MISGCICWLHLYWLLTCAKTYGILHECILSGQSFFFVLNCSFIDDESSYMIWYTFRWTLDMWIFFFNSVSIFSAYIWVVNKLQVVNETMYICWNILRILFIVYFNPFLSSVQSLHACKRFNYANTISSGQLKCFAIIFIECLK